MATETNGTTTNQNAFSYIECDITKLIAVESGREFNTILHKVYGHKVVHTSPLDDLITILDAHLDSSLACRMLVRNHD